jgi:hypothetical protein
MWGLSLNISPVGAVGAPSDVPAPVVVTTYSMRARLGGPIPRRNYWHRYDGAAATVAMRETENADTCQAVPIDVVTLMTIATSAELARRDIARV